MVKNENPMHAIRVKWRTIRLFKYRKIESTHKLVKLKFDAIKNSIQFTFIFWYDSDTASLHIVHSRTRWCTLILPYCILILLTSSSLSPYVLNEFYILDILYWIICERVCTPFSRKANEAESEFSVVNQILMNFTTLHVRAKKKDVENEKMKYWRESRAIRTKFEEKANIFVGKVLEEKRLRLCVSFIEFHLDVKCPFSCCIEKLSNNKRKDYMDEDETSFIFILS